MQAEGAVQKMTPIVSSDADQPLWATDVLQRDWDWAGTKEKATKPFSVGNFVAEPLVYVLPPTDTAEPFYKHNHCPSLTWLANGDLLAIWYSTNAEHGTELTILASRLRAGEKQWDASSEFFKSSQHNMHGSSLFYDHDGDGMIYHFNGMAAEGVQSWSDLALLMRTSRDNGVSWSVPTAMSREFRFRNQVISGTLRTKAGLLIQPCDAVPGAKGGTALHISHDDGLTWKDPGLGKPKPQFVAGGSGVGTIAGIHAKVVELKDGRLLAFGRDDSIDGRMPQSVSSDLGKTWTYSASPFPPIGGGQRLVLKRLNEGPLLFVSFTGSDHRDPESNTMMVIDSKGYPFLGKGMYAAVSFDDGETWPLRKLLTPGSGTFNGGAWTQAFTASPTRAEHAGYLAVTQTPDNVIHLISSRLHYRITLDWLLQGWAETR